MFLIQVRPINVLIVALTDGLGFIWDTLYSTIQTVISENFIKSIFKIFK